MICLIVGTLLSFLSLSSSAWTEAVTTTASASAPASTYMRFIKPSPCVDRPACGPPVGRPSRCCHETRGQERRVFRSPGPLYDPRQGQDTRLLTRRSPAPPPPTAPARPAPAASSPPPPAPDAPAPPPA